jgi:hypothetical protein
MIHWLIAGAIGAVLQIGISYLIACLISATL